MIFALSLQQMRSSSFHMFIYARSEQCEWAVYIWQKWAGPIYTIKIHSVSEFIQVNWNSSWSKFHWIQDVYMANMPKKPNSIHASYYWEFIRTPLFRWVQIRSVSRFVQLCCKFTRVNAFTPWYKRVGAYQGNYLSTFFCVLILFGLIPIPMLRLNELN